jgi:hypothetical protein
MPSTCGWEGGGQPVWPVCVHTSRDVLCACVCVAERGVVVVVVGGRDGEAMMMPYHNAVGYGGG